MANYDPALRREWWLFQQIGTGPDGKPLYKRLPYNWVSYDNNPERVLEPIADVSRANLIGDGTIIKPSTHFGRIAGFEIVTTRPIDVFGVDDFDAALTTGL